MCVTVTPGGSGRPLNRLSSVGRILTGIMYRQVQSGLSSMTLMADKPHPAGPHDHVSGPRRGRRAAAAAAYAPCCVTIGPVPDPSCCSSVAEVERFVKHRL